jgi:hypothetical protein
MAGIGFLHGIHGQSANGVGCQVVHSPSGTTGRLSLKYQHLQSQSKKWQKGKWPFHGKPVIIGESWRLVPAY